MRRLWPCPPDCVHARFYFLPVRALCHRSLFSEISAAAGSRMFGLRAKNVTLGAVAGASVNERVKRGAATGHRSTNKPWRLPPSQNLLTTFIACRMRPHRDAVGRRGDFLLGLTYIDYRCLIREFIPASRTFRERGRNVQRPESFFCRPMRCHGHECGSTIGGPANNGAGGAGGPADAEGPGRAGTNKCRAIRAVSVSPRGSNHC